MAAQISQVEGYSRQEAESRDARDPLRSFREEFIIPSRKDLMRKTLAVEGWSIHIAIFYTVLTLADRDTSESCIYLCGNSLGLQPRNTQKYIDYYLRTWATKGVTGHFTSHDDQLLPPFVDVDEAGSELMAPVVGALQSEVAVMGSLTANIHVLLGSFYRPTKERFRIIMEGKAFPSDHVGDTCLVFEEGGLLTWTK